MRLNRRSFLAAASAALAALKLNPSKLFAAGRTMESTPSVAWATAATATPIADLLACRELANRKYGYRHDYGPILIHTGYRLRSLKSGDLVTLDWRNRAIPWKPGMNNAPVGAVFDVLNPHVLRIAVSC